LGFGKPTTLVAAIKVMDDWYRSAIIPILNHIPARIETLLKESEKSKSARDYDKALDSHQQAWVIYNILNTMSDLLRKFWLEFTEPVDEIFELTLYMEYYQNPDKYD